MGKLEKRRSTCANFNKKGEKVIFLSDRKIEKKGDFKEIFRLYLKVPLQKKNCVLYLTVFKIIINRNQDLL